MGYDIIIPEEGDSSLPGEWYYSKHLEDAYFAALKVHPLETVYFKSIDHDWQGYDNQQVILITDFAHRHSYAIHKLLYWVGDKPIFTEVSPGQSVWVNPSKVVVISFYHPKDIYDERSYTYTQILKTFHINRVE